MNYKITFSTYVNATGTSTPRKRLLSDLIEIANNNRVQGWTLSDQTGYWAGEVEQSHALTLLDIEPVQAKKVAEAIKLMYSQDAVILEQLPNTGVEFI